MTNSSALLNEAHERAVEFLSSAFADTAEKIDFLIGLGEEYSENAALFTACVRGMVSDSNRQLYLSVFPLVEYK